MVGEFTPWKLTNAIIRALEFVQRSQYTSLTGSLESKLYGMRSRALYLGPWMVWGQLTSGF